MTLSITSSGLSGLYANQVMLENAGHNLANATVEGYHRQRVILQTQDSVSRGSFFVGRGVDVQTVERVYDRFVEQQLREARSDEGLLDTLQQQVNQVTNLLQDGGQTLTSSMQAFFGAFSGLAGTPTSTPQRQLVLSTGAALSGAFATIQRRLDVIRDGLDNGIDSAVTQLDDAARNLARINGLVVEQNSSRSGPSPDLLDERDRLVNRIASLVNTTTLLRNDGTVTLLIADGRTLVEGNRAAQVSASRSETAPADLTAYLEIGGVKTRINELAVNGGVLGGLFQMRRETLDYTEAQMGRLALSVAAEINEQHKSGYDLDGVAGRDIFLLDENTLNNVPESVLDGLFNTQTLYGESVGRRVQGSIRNEGTAQIRYTVPVDPAEGLETRLDNVRQLTGDAYSVVFRGGDPLDAASYEVRTLFNGRRVELGAGALTPAGAGSSTRIEFEGVRLLIDDPSQLRSGDSFELRPTSGLAGLLRMNLSDPRDIAAAQGSDDGSGGIESRPGDGRNAQALADLQRAGRIGSLNPTEASSFAESFAEIAGTVGVQAESAKLRGNAQTALVRQLEDQQQSLSGVNLDEEAASLLRFQQAYQASAKLISIAGSLLQAVLDI